MAEDKDDQSRFRVVDRRSFSADGTRREVEEDREKAEAQETPPPHPAPAQRVQEAEDDIEANAGGFETLVSYLSTTAMFQLGLLPGPGGERIPPDLPNAHRTIDLLDVLREKTRGNLNENEAKLLDDVLYELRMSYVEIEKRMPAKGK